MSFGELLDVSDLSEALMGVHSGTGKEHRTHIDVGMRSVSDTLIGSHDSWNLYIILHVGEIDRKESLLLLLFFWLLDW